MPTIHRSILALSLLLLSAAPLGCDVDDPCAGGAECSEQEAEFFRWVDGRREFDALECVSYSPYECHGSWETSTAWSRVYLYYSEIATLQTVNPATMWACDPYPDVDICVIVDAQGHKGCYRNMLGWAVAVVPTCVATGSGWIYVGNDMKSKVAYYE